MPGTFSETNAAAIGYTSFETDVRALFGYSFKAGAWPAFLDLQVAQRFRVGDNVPNEFRFDATLGVRPAERWLILLQSFNVVSEGDAGPTQPSYDYSKLQLSVVYDVTKAWSLQVGGFTTVAGRNALQENGALLAAWYRW